MSGALGKKLKEFNMFRIDSQKLKKSFIEPDVDFDVFPPEEIDQSVVERFESMVDKYPERIAVKAGDHIFTYRELNQIANAIAVELIESVNMRNRGISLLFEHGAEMIAAILGVLKSGNYYIPLDPTYPPGRLVYMLKDSNSGCLLSDTTNNDLAGRLVKDARRNIQVMDIKQISRPAPAENPSIKIIPPDWAYILYTSGSTGIPKGVVQCHRNILHFIRVYTNNLHLNRDDRLTLFSSYSFDAAVMAIYGALLNGAALYPYNIKENGKMDDMGGWLRQEKITIYHSVPTVFRFFTEGLNGHEGFPDIRFIVLGGEEVLKKDILSYKRIFPDHCLFINGLGPTESTVTLQYIIDKKTNIQKEIVPVGFPVDRTNVFLLDENDTEANIFGTGEIVYNSDYLALGYLNKPEKTDEAFGPNPLPGGKSRIYRSGDLGKRLPDGTIEFIGRSDFQVKIRGYRVELSEIESILDKLPGIKKSVIACWKSKDNENFLAGYYVKNPRKNDKDKEIDETVLIETLKASLPGFMIPRIFINLTEFPLTPTGKIDRKALPQTQDVSTREMNSYLAPRNEEEKKLADIWKDILKLEKIDIRGDFFELGGHSLKAILLTTEVHKAFNIKLPLAEIFKAPTIRDMAVSIKSAAQNKFHSIKKAAPREYYPLSSAQERLYLLQEMNPEKVTYNMSGAFLFEGKLDKEKFTRAFQELVNRHESFRTSFFMQDGQIVQKITDHIEFKLSYKKIGSEEAIESRIKKIVSPFDLRSAPLLRVELIELDKEKHFVLYDMHHIISDGISQDILQNEFAALYEGKTLEPVTIRYKDYAVWQKQLLNGEYLREQEQYWLEKMKGFRITRFPVHDLNYYSQAKGASESSTINGEAHAKITAFCNRHKVTKFMFMTTVFNIILAIEIDQMDITLGTPYANRDHHGLKNVIGVFLNVLLIRNRFDPGDSFLDVLSKVKESIYEAMNNSFYPYELLDEKLKEINGLKEAELFTILVNYLNVDKTGGMSNAEFTIKPVPSKEISPKYCVTLYIWDSNDQMAFSLVYKSSVIEQRRILRIVKNFSYITDIVLGNEQIKIQDINMVDNCGIDNFEEEMEGFFENDDLVGL